MVVAALSPVWVRERGAGSEWEAEQVSSVLVTLKLAVGGWRDFLGGPKAISPPSCWMNCELINPWIYLDMERILEDILAPLSLYLGKLRPREVKGSVQIPAVTLILPQTGPHSKSLQES